MANTPHKLQTTDNERPGKRDYIKEIMEKEKRFPESAALRSSNSQRVHELIDLHAQSEKQPKTHKAAISEYVIVKGVAILQSAFKEVIREVIDHNEEKGLPLPEIKEEITLAMVRDFKGNKVSLGAFVSHIVSANSYSQIKEQFENVCNERLDKLVIAYIDDLLEYGDDEADTRMEDAIAIYGDVKGDLYKLFTHRNFICHEFTPDELLLDSTVQTWLYSLSMVAGSLDKYKAKFHHLRKKKKA